MIEMRRERERGRERERERRSIDSSPRASILSVELPHATSIVAQKPNSGELIRDGALDVRQRHLRRRCSVNAGPARH